jgi:hypothetical protein
VRLRGYLGNQQDFDKLIQRTLSSTKDSLINKFPSASNSD